MSLIRSKVRLPRWRSDLLSRPRLVEYVRSNLTRKLILIVAPPGYGKTTLLLDFVQHGDTPCCWYSLDENDRDPRLFLEYLAVSIQQQFPRFGERTLEALNDFKPLRADLSRLIGVMVNEIYESIADDFVLILDNFESIDDSPDISQILEALLRYLPDHVHILLASRTFPQRSAVTLPLIATGEVVGVSGQLLRFQAAEVMELAQLAYGLILDADTATRIVDQCEGWIMGIQLSSNALRRRELDSVLPAEVDRNLLYEYMAAEILAPLPRDSHDFLLRSSILQPLTAELVNAALSRSDAAEQLRSLAERLPMLVTTLDGDGAYRYHGLLIDFLGNVLRRDVATFRAAHLAAGRAQASRGALVEAVGHYVEADQPDEAAAVAATAIDELYATGRWQTIGRIFDRLPRTARKPEILLAEALRLKEQGDNEAAILLLAEVETHGDPRSQIMARARRANIWGLQGRHQTALSLFREALYATDPHDLMLLAEVERGMGRAYYGLGENASALEHFESALRLFEQAGSATNVAHLNHELGSVQSDIGRLDAAYHSYQRALAHWDATSATGWRLTTLNNIADLYYTQGRWQDALAIHDEIGPAARDFGYTIIEATSRLTVGAIRADMQDYNAALDALSEGLESAERGDYPYLIAYGLDVIGNVYRHLGDVNEAQARLEEALGLAQIRALPQQAAQTMLSLGLLALDRGDTNQAAEWLERARDAFSEQDARAKVASTEFALARLDFRRRDTASARGRLDEVARLSAELGYDQFLVDAAAEDPDLAQWAARHAANPSFWGQIRRRVARHGQVGALPPPPLEVTSLGRAKIRVLGEDAAAQWANLRELFFYLLARHPSGARRDEIIDTFWPDSSATNASQSLKVALHRLRRAFCQTRHEAGWYSLVLPDGYVYDAGRFQALAAVLEGSEALTPDRAADLRRAVDLYQGDYLPEYYSDWVVSERDRLKQLYSRILLTLGPYYEGGGDLAAALEVYQKCLNEDEYQEAAHQGMMRTYMALGDRHRAIQHFRELVQVLRRDLGIDPAVDTQRLYQQILQGTA